MIAHLGARELATVVGVSTQAVHAWKNGTSVPAVQHLPKIAKLIARPLGDVTAAVARDAEALRGWR